MPTGVSRWLLLRPWPPRLILAPETRDQAASAGPGSADVLSLCPFLDIKRSGHHTLQNSPSFICESPSTFLVPSGPRRAGSSVSKKRSEGHRERKKSEGLRPVLSWGTSAVPTSTPTLAPAPTPNCGQLDDPIAAGALSTYAPSWSLIVCVSTESQKIHPSTSRTAFCDSVLGYLVSPSCLRPKVTNSKPENQWWQPPETKPSPQQPRQNRATSAAPPRTLVERPSVAALALESRPCAA